MTYFHHLKVLKNFLFLKENNSTRRQHGAEKWPVAVNNPCQPSFFCLLFILT